MAVTEGQWISTARGRMTREEKNHPRRRWAPFSPNGYDFYLYGSLAAIIGAQFFTSFPRRPRNVFALLAFAAGFIDAPSAFVFGSLGDLVGRKYTFLMTIPDHGHVDLHRRPAARL